MQHYYKCVSNRITIARTLSIYIWPIKCQQRQKENGKSGMSICTSYDYYDISKKNGNRITVCRKWTK